MFIASQAQVGLESHGPDGCHGERLACERADAAFGLQDGAGQAQCTGYTDQYRCPPAGREH